MTMTCPYFSHLTMSQSSTRSRSEILYDYAIKRANTIIGSQEMTPERMKKMISDFIDTQGLDAPLLSCACCGFRNLDMTSSKHTRSYSEVDLAGEKIQSMLKLRDEDDDEDRVDVEDDPTIQLGSLHTLQCHRQAMEREPLSIPYDDDGNTKEVEAWRLNSVWPAKKPEELVEDSCLLYTSPSPRDVEESRMPSSA